MICQACGAAADPVAAQCGACGVSLIERPPLPDRSPIAEAAALFGCLPFGLVALGYASKVEVKAALGDPAGAAECAAEARRWTQRAFLAGAFIWICALLGMVLAGLSVKPG